MTTHLHIHTADIDLKTHLAPIGFKNINIVIRAFHCK